MKLTRKHYNRKILSFGLVLFLAVALLSTGFAAWIMSTGAEEENGGNVSIGAVTDGSLEFTEVKWAGDNNLISFDAKENDVTGSIKWDGSNAENLIIEITGKINPKEYLDDLTIVMDMERFPASVKAAADAGYIVLPDCAKEGGVVLVENGVANDGGTVFAAVKGADGDDYWTFSYKVIFKWGEKFNGKNPSVHLDEFTKEVPDGEGTKIVSLTYEEKIKEMLAFKRTIYGFSAVEGDANYKSDEEVLSYVDNLEFKMTITATAK